MKEAQSIVPLIHEMPLLAIYLVGSILAALAAGLANLRRRWTDAAVMSLVILVIAIALGLWQQKLQPYVSLLAVPMLAVAMARVGSDEKAAVPRNFSATARRSMSAAAVLAAATQTFIVARTDVVDELLAEIETGTECNMGPVLLAWTKLDALSAPYHRLGRGIASGHAIMNSGPLEAERRMRTEGARYVIVCPHLNGTHYAGQKPDNALMTLLLKDEVPAFLTPVPLDRRTTLKVFQLAN